MGSNVLLLFRDPFIELLQVGDDVGGGGLILRKSLDVVLELLQCDLSFGYRLFLVLNDALQFLQLIVEAR